MTIQLAYGLYAFCIISTVTGILDWSPCSGSRPHDSSEPSSYVVAIDNYVYIHCTSPGAGSYLMQCPGSTVWNAQANGCTDFGGHNQSPPRLVGPLAGATGGIRDVPTSTSSPTVNSQITAGYQQPLHRFFAGLPYSSLSSVSGPPSTLFRPAASGTSVGDLASQMTANPCVVDDRGTLSPLRFHPYPNNPSKYLECVPAERSIVVRRCSLVGASVWSQELQTCVGRGPTAGGPQVQPPHRQSSSNAAGYRHPQQLTYAEKHRGNTAPAAPNNPCRHGGPPFYRAHPTRSSMYYQCSATGRAFARRCPRGLRWNQRAMTCDRSAPGSMYRLQSLR